MVRIAMRSPCPVGKYLSKGLGMGIVYQAFINMAVAVNLFPVTGQTLPLVSAGGSSIWMTCIALGMIISVSRSFMEGTEGAEDGRESENSENSSEATAKEDLDNNSLNPELA
jgi:cell division protein FtsW